MSDSKPAKEDESKKRLLETVNHEKDDDITCIGNEDYVRFLLSVEGSRVKKIKLSIRHEIAKECREAILKRIRQVDFHWEFIDNDEYELQIVDDIMQIIRGDDDL